MSEPGDRYWEAVEPYWDEISIYKGRRVFLSQFRGAPPAIRNLFAAHWVQTEVRNGGFLQFFENPTGVLAPEGIVGYQELGMPKTAQCVRAACAWFGRAYPRGQLERQRRLKREGASYDDSPFDGIDARFYSLIDREGGGFAKLADRYATKHDC
jgi:hypothetical protein